MAGQNTKSAEFRDSSGDENEFMDSKGLLEEYGKEQIILKRTGLRRGHKWCLFALVTLSLLLNVMLLSIGAFLYQRRGPASPIFPQALYSPAQDVLKYEVVKFDTAFGHGKTKYQGDPSPELDKLWEDLFLLELQIPREQAKLLPNKTISVHPDLPDSFAVGLGVFHDLHCLNTLRRGLDYFNFQLWNDTHNPLNTPLHLLDDDHRLGGPLDPPHLSHCIDHLRQAIQCHSDISAVVWQWSEAAHDNKIYGSTVRTCRNFDAVRQWATEHDYSKIIYSPEKPEELGLCGAFDQGCGN
ncbi:hypothetical protein Purlil1_4884 [Purpureocillium lilacinum]|uniref:Tat pathway signal sequence n=1 Tax=Purpureocillium lilacinum TaxID=33203 RepID=A0ABR0C302_PURLI|nr:hypothetical protein Purlil1_4884 [Purpureocillium lilacinum]